MKKMVSALLGLVLMAACAPGSPVSTPSPTATSTPTAIPIPTWLAHLPAGMVAILSDDGSWGVESVAPSAPHERLPVTAERVKNVSASFEIRLDNTGKNITGLPEGKTQEEKDAVKGFYEAIRNKFPSSQVFYNPNPEGDGWIVYAVRSGKLVHETISYAGGPEQYFDYPIFFDDSKGYWEVVGNYQELEIPENGEVGVIWDNGLPQFVAGKVSLSDGESAYLWALNYKSYIEDENPWTEIAGVAEILATPTPEAPEIVWDLSDPEAFPSKSFEYLTSTEFAQQVLDWEAQGRFPQVPDTAIPFQEIDVFLN